jgi:hypothetical protein
MTDKLLPVLDENGEQLKGVKQFAFHLGGIVVLMENGTMWTNVKDLLKHYE